MKGTNKKSVIIFSIVIIVVIAAVIVIILFKNNSYADEQVMACIASKSQMYGSATCPHCAEQKQILGNYAGLFNITDCYTDIGKCTKEKIEYFPTWIISGEKYVGVKSIEELKTISNC